MRLAQNSVNSQSLPSTWGSRLVADWPTCLGVGFNFVHDHKTWHEALERHEWDVWLLPHTATTSYKALIQLRSTKHKGSLYLHSWSPLSVSNLIMLFWFTPKSYPTVLHAPLLSRTNPSLKPLDSKPWPLALPRKARDERVVRALEGCRPDLQHKPYPTQKTLDEFVKAR